MEEIQQIISHQQEVTITKFYSALA